MAIRPKRFAASRCSPPSRAISSNSSATDNNIVAHNAPFDMKFVNHELRLAGFDEIPNHRVVDTLALARRKFPGGKHTLDVLCNRFGIDLSRREKHGALLDSQLLADVYVELRGGRQRGMSLEVETPTNAPIQAPAPTAEFARRHFPLGEADRNRHRAFLESIPNPLWERYLD